MKQLEELSGRLGHRFSDPQLLDRALCHASTGNEGLASYERLEFLGDAILGFLVAAHLYSSCPDLPEGELSDRRALLVSRQPLADVAKALDLGSHLIGGRSLRESDRHSPRILSDLTESVLAAIYLDGGIRAARAFVTKHVIPPTRSRRKSPRHLRDPKSRLQHLIQVQARERPRYELLETAGPDHELRFLVAVHLGEELVAKGLGSTKQAAEMEAARIALARLEQRAPSDPGRGEP